MIRPCSHERLRAGPRVLRTSICSRTLNRLQTAPDTLRRRRHSNYSQTPLRVSAVLIRADSPSPYGYVRARDGPSRGRPTCACATYPAARSSGRRSRGWQQRAASTYWLSAGRCGRTFRWIRVSENVRPFIHLGLMMTTVPANNNGRRFASRD